MLLRSGLSYNIRNKVLNFRKRKFISQPINLISQFDFCQFHYRFSTSPCTLWKWKINLPMYP